jgi:NAD-dependent oxidoreductase involved in siderophore biosynthesis
MQIQTRQHQVMSIQIVFAMLDLLVLTMGIVQNVQLENSSMRLAIIHVRSAWKVNILLRLVPHQTSARGV